MNGSSGRRGPLGRGAQRARLLPPLAVAAALALGGAACGDDSESEPAAAGTPSKPTQLDVSYIEVTSAAPLMLGVEQGFFKEEGLEVRPKPTEAAATIPAVVSGDVDITFTNPPATLLGKSNGLPLKAIAPAAVSDPDKDAYIQLVTKKGSGIESISDLAGKKVAVDTLFQLPHIALLHGAESAGGDTSKWDITEIPYPAMGQALKSGKVDAALVGEPFLNQALAQGNVSIGSVYAGWEKDTPFSMYVTSERFLNQNRDVVERFGRAMKRANEYAEANQDAVRKVIPTFMKMPAKVAEQVILPIFSPTLNVEGLATWKTVMDERGVLKKDADVAALTDGVQ